MSILLAIEGIDGTGKGTQTQLLVERCARLGVSACVFSFPQYGQNRFSEAIARYLNGAFGDPEGVAPELSALLYACDRYLARPRLLEALEQADVVICDRYVASNLAHQACKAPPTERERISQWLYDVEFREFAMPTPDLTLLLDLPESTAMELVRKKDRRSYTPLVADHHEMNAGYMAAAAREYRRLAKRSWAGPWRHVQCLGSGGLRDPHEIAGEVWSYCEAALGISHA